MTLFDLPHVTAFLAGVVWTLIIITITKRGIL